MRPELVSRIGIVDAKMLPTCVAISVAGSSQVAGSCITRFRAGVDADSWRFAGGRFQCSKCPWERGTHRRAALRDYPSPFDCCTDCVQDGRASCNRQDPPRPIAPHSFSSLEQVFGVLLPTLGVRTADATKSQAGDRIGSSTDVPRNFGNWYNSGPLEVEVFVNGIKAECAAPEGCKFEYNRHGHHTGKLERLEPRDVRPGTLLKVSGSWRSEPFAFEELNAPRMEVPLSSVKIANRAPEQQEGQNEPFGKSGTRCALFNAELEEPFGITEGSSQGWIKDFICKVNGPREAGRYNVSVALLGKAMIPDRDMYGGESLVHPYLMQSDHHGVSYMLQHVPVVTSVFPSKSGTSGGNRITLTGDSFSNDHALAHVWVHGTPCLVETATIEKIVCVLEPRSVAPAADATVPAGRGVRARVWKNVAALDSDEKKLENFKANTVFASPDLAWEEGSLLEMPRNLLAEWNQEDATASGPGGLFDGFFRPPVSGNVTFMMSMDDIAEMYLVREPGSTSDLEQVIDTQSGWSPFRDFTQRMVSNGYYSSPDNDFNFYGRRTSEQIPLIAGEKYYMQAWYHSGGGDDHLSVGAIFHNASVNRKDRPAAIDDTQIISVNHTMMQLETIEITLEGTDMAGSFLVSAGNKTSRAISVSATEFEMQAAMRELFSNCRGGNGDIADTSGATFECFQGRGFEYRGLANTHSGGEPCAAWDQSPSWHPRLVSAAGLTGNLCRNPDWATRGPWCYSLSGHKKSCDVPRCGNSSSPKSFVATMEADPEDSSLIWDGVHALQSRYSGGDLRGPESDYSTSYCGKVSAVVPLSQTRIRPKGDFFHAQEHGAYAVLLKETPYFCFAYKIPPGVEADIHMDISRELGQNEFDWRTQWRAIQLSGKLEKDRYIGSIPGILDDGRWHHACIDLWTTIDDWAASNSDLIQGNEHRITNVYFTKALDGWEENTLLGTDKIWVDEMSFSAQPRIVTQETDPAYGGGVMVSSVKRTATAGAVTWKVSLTTASCEAPGVDFSVDVSGVTATGTITPAVTRTNAHSERLSGQVGVEFRGERVSFSPYATSEEARTALLSLSTVGDDIRVQRFGVCQAGFDYQVTFTHAPGDQPRMTASTAGLSSPDVSATVSDVEHGGVLVAPLPADYFHLPGASGVVAVVDESTALCARNLTGAAEPARCAFTWDESLNPSVTDMVYSDAVGGEFEITVTGTNFGEPSFWQDAPSPEVSFGGVQCGQAGLDGDKVSCYVSPPPLLAPGDYSVEVMVPGRGKAISSKKIEWRLDISSVTPASVNPSVPTVLTVHGSGFHPVLEKNNFEFDGENCTALSVNATQVTCLYFKPGAQSSTSGTRRRLLSLDTPHTPRRSLLSTFTVEVVESSPPTVTGVDPSEGSAAGGDTVTVSGTGFSDSAVVTFGGVNASVQSASATELVVTAPPGALGDMQVMVSTAEGGASSEAAQVFSYFLYVSELDLHAGVGLAGGATLSVGGRGFVSAAGVKANMSLLLPGTEVYVVGLYTAQRMSAENVTGDFTLHLDGLASGPLGTNNSADEIEDELRAAFPHAQNLHVAIFDAAPGQFINRFYPRQWEISFSRLDVAGAGIDRCTDPLFVDWDPDACPDAAADLFLHHYPWSARPSHCSNSKR